jgi:replicative DNA helicase
MLSDLREGGSIEQDADKVLFVYRPEYYKITEYEDGSTTSGKAEIHVAKNRMGPIDSVRLIFDHTTQLFEADKEAPSYYRFGDFDFPPSRDDEFPPAPF